MITSKFNYTSLSRVETPDGRKYVDPSGVPLPSVTTILSATAPYEKVQALNNWKKKVGEKKAAEVSAESAGRGTRMHKFLEEYVELDHLTEAGTNPYSIQAHAMASTVVSNGLVNCNEFWGNEVQVYSPSLFAGTTDLIGVHLGTPAIIDFKQTNKPKKTEWITDYFIQLCFYATGHNDVYNTDIKKGVIMMCSPSLEYQEWVIEGAEWDKYLYQMWKRLEAYHSR